MNERILEEMKRYNRVNNYKWHNQEMRIRERPTCGLCTNDTTFDNSVSYEGYGLICDRCTAVIAGITGMTTNEVRTAVKEMGKQMMFEENEELAGRHELEE